MAYRIKVTIVGIEPKIWRRIKIPGNITFKQLHQIIQASFGWLDCHLYKFLFDDEDKNGFDADNTKINELFDVNDRCLYRYDFGDDWNHEIIIERRLKDTKKSLIPICMAGARYRPPEDVGGILGYESFIKIISDTKNPKRNDTLAWAEKDTRGRIYDPDYFNINEVNRKLSMALLSDYETAVKILTGNNGLSGVLAWGWSDALIDCNGTMYPLEWIADMLIRLGEGSKVTIKVEEVDL